MTVKLVAVDNKGRFIAAANDNTIYLWHELSRDPTFLEYGDTVDSHRCESIISCIALEFGFLVAATCSSLNIWSVSREMGMVGKGEYPVDECRGIRLFLEPGNKRVLKITLIFPSAVKILECWDQNIEELGSVDFDYEVWDARWIRSSRNIMHHATVGLDEEYLIITLDNKKTRCSNFGQGVKILDISSSLEILIHNRKGEVWVVDGLAKILRCSKGSRNSKPLQMCSGFLFADISSSILLSQATPNNQGGSIFELTWQSHHIFRPELEASFQWTSAIGFHNHIREVCGNGSMIGLHTKRGVIVFDLDQLKTSTELKTILDKSFRSHKMYLK